MATRSSGRSSAFIGEIRSKLLFPARVTCCFLADVICFGLLGWQMMQALLCLYVVQVLACATEIRLMVLISLLLLESLMFYDTLFMPLLYLAPVLLWGVCARYMLYPGVAQRLSMLGLVLVAQCLAEVWVLGLVWPVHYILYRICVNLVLVLFV
ncbi:hypothetical protein JST99_02380 [Candidatus Dependentiae bacterium]|nr:hypothetical protein [Candidatus Dependentiae bacterium]MCC7414513.1 hypothetical protein [Campylobacterota bacterium]